MRSLGPYPTTCKSFIVTLTNHTVFHMACCLFLLSERPTRRNLGLSRCSQTYDTHLTTHLTWRLPAALSHIGPILPAGMHGDMSILCHLSHLHLSMRLCALFCVNGVHCIVSRCIWYTGV